MSERGWQPTSELITAEQVPELLAKYGVVVIHCGAVWNKNDFYYDAVIQAVKPTYAGHITFFAMDIDDELNQNFVRGQGFMNIPVSLCFVNGDRMDLKIGWFRQDGLIKMLDGWLEAAKERLKP